MTDEATLVRRGYAALGPATDKEVQALSDMMGRKGFEVRKQSDRVWVRLEPVPSMLRLYEPIVAANANHKAPYFPLEKDISKWETQSPIRYDQDALDYAINEFHSKTGYECFVALRKVIMLLPPAILPTFIKDNIAPVFFAKYPNGKIWYVARTDASDTLSAVLRNLALIKTYGMKQGLAMTKGVGTPVLRAGHSRGMIDIGPSLTVLLAGFAPYIYGFPCGRLNSYLLFQVDQPLEVEPRYPWDEYDFLRPSPLYGEDVAENVQELFSTKFKDPKLIYRKYRHGQPWSPGEVDMLLRWWVRSLDKVLSTFLNPCNFRDASGAMLPLSALASGLTWDRIQHLTATIQTERNTFVRKSLFFQLLDQYGSLLADPSIRSDEIAVFQNLLRYSHFQAVLEPKLKGLPIPFDDYMVKWSAELYEDVQRSVLHGVWDRARVHATHVTIPKWNTTSKVFEDHDMTTEDYVVTTLKTLRNTLHGYRLQRYQFESYLFPQTANISEYLPDISLPLMIALLADPQSAVSLGWR